jgi:hypothetical protein
MEVAWSKVGAIRRILEDFPLEISQRLICLVGSARPSLVPTAAKRILCCWFSGACEKMGQVLNVQGAYVEKLKHFSNQYSYLFKFYIHL